MKNARGKIKKGKGRRKVGKKVNVSKWKRRKECGKRNWKWEEVSGKQNVKVGKHKSKWESVGGMGKVKEGDWNSLMENGKGEVGNWKWETESESKKEINVG